MQQSNPYKPHRPPGESCSAVKTRPPAWDRIPNLGSNPRPGSADMDFGRIYKDFYALII